MAVADARLLCAVAAAPPPVSSQQACHSQQPPEKTTCPPYAPPMYWQPQSVPPVCTWNAPAQPFYQEQPQQPAGPNYYVTAPPPAAYPYTEQDVSMNPGVLGKNQPINADTLEQGGTPKDDGNKEDAISPELDISVRHAFVRKVYCILSLQLLMTFAVSITFALVPPLAKWLIRNWWLGAVGCCTAMVLIIILVCFPYIGRRFPLNFVVLTLITLGFTICVAGCVAKTTTYAFFFACGITTVVVVTITIFAIQVKYDFTSWGPYLVVALVVLLIAGILCCIFQDRITDCVIAGVSAVVFSFILVYDTQRVVGGKHRRYTYSIDDYIFAALTLYLDIVTIFLEILTIINKA